MFESHDPILIHRLAPRNFLSFGPENHGIELKALNVLIGPNGSGKSNLIEAINFMRAAPKKFSDVTRKGGGVAEWIWKGTPDGAGEVSWVLKRNSMRNLIKHHVEFRAMSGSRFLVTDESVENPRLAESNQEGIFYSSSWDGGPAARYRDDDGKWQMADLKQDVSESVLAELRDMSRYPEITWLGEVYGKIRIYREWVFGRNSVFREPQKADMRNDVLEEDFSNLGLFLSKLRKVPKAKKAVIENLQKLYDGLTDFDVHIEGGTVQVFFTEGDFVIPATRLSDGTLRFLCLLAILCDPDPPPLICIEEPELGLHPDILPTVADLLKSASERTQLIITTHSDILVDAMTETPECVVICEKHAGKTEMKRLSSDELAVWLEQYRLGQLWIDGQLGGKRW
jgi:predicted ATPase